MQACAGTFAYGVKAGHGGLSVQINEDAAAEIMGAGNHGDRVGADVNADILAFLEHRGKARGQIGFDARGVEVKTGSPACEHLLHHGLGNDIAGCEIAARIVFLHERHALVVHEVRAFAAHGLGDERAAGHGVREECRGVELHEFQIGERNARARGHGDGRTHTGRGIRGVQKNLPHAACGQNRMVGDDGHDAARVLVEHVGADTAVHDFVAHLGRGGAVMRGQKIYGRMSVENGDVFVGSHFLTDAVHDGLAGVVGLVQDAPASVAAFSCQIPVSFRVFVEFDA